MEKEVNLNSSKKFILPDGSKKNLYLKGMNNSSVLMGDTAIFNSHNIVLPKVRVNYQAN